jgi:predicted transcriptional regulator of viral defense system
MRHLQLDYRVGLLRAAAFHGSSHQAAMVFQLIVPRQIRALEIGRHRLEFVYQSLAAFREVNRDPWLAQLKSDAGYAKVSGVELTLLDCARYFHKAGGINGLAQIVKDLGELADPASLALIADHYENSCVRRLGYLLEHMGHPRQADALRPFARKAKSAVLLDPSVKPLSSVLSGVREMQPAWGLVINEQVEVDS